MGSGEARTWKFLGEFGCAAEVWRFCLVLSSATSSLKKRHTPDQTLLKTRFELSKSGCPKNTNGISTSETRRPKPRTTVTSRNEPIYVTRYTANRSVGT